MLYCRFEARADFGNIISTYICMSDYHLSKTFNQMVATKGQRFTDSYISIFLYTYIRDFWSLPHLVFYRMSIFYSFAISSSCQIFIVYDNISLNDNLFVLFLIFGLVLFEGAICCSFVWSYLQFTCFISITTLCS